MVNLDAMESDEHLRPVAEALPEMTRAIRNGNMLQARSIGERCIVPLSLTSADVTWIGKLSAGAEATVHQARWRGLDVAVKKVRISTSSDLDRFRRELQLLAELSHPAVVPLLGARALPPDYWLVLPLAAGGNVRQALYDKGWRPSWRQLLALAHSVASGMEAVHAAGVIHRDLKPANLLLLAEPPPPHPDRLDPAQPSDVPSEALGTPLGEPQSEPLATASCSPPSTSPSASPSSSGGVCPAEHVRVQIADFGIAVHVKADGVARPGGEEQGDEAAAAAAGTAGRQRGGRGRSGKPSGGFHKEQMVGTLEYMAPELLLRTAPAGRASDVYAWAVTVNEIATGVVPFSDCTKDNPEVHTVLEMGYGRLELAAAVVGEGLRPLLPRGPCPPGLVALLGACWAADPKDRPSFTQVRQALKRIAQDLPVWEQQQQQQSGAAVPGPARAQALLENGSKPDEAPHTAVVSAMAVDAPTGVEAAGTAAAGPAPAPAPFIEAPFVLCPEGHDPFWEAGRCPRAAVNGCGNSESGVSSTHGSSSERAAPYFRAGVFEAIGPRDTMEDRHVILDDLLSGSSHSHSGGQHLPSSTNGSGERLPLPPQHAPVPVAAVFDGHRGSGAAELCRLRLVEVLREALLQGASGGGGGGGASPADALRRTFVQLEEEYYARWLQRHSPAAAARHGSAISYPGTTALVALVVPSPGAGAGGRTLYIANAGDCRAVLCRGRRALAGSRDHTGLLEDERSRLQAAGVTVSWQHGGWRIGSTGLQVTRCIGDFDVKPDMSSAAVGGGGAAVAAARGVTAVPEVTAVQLGPDDHFLILASDGLWDVISVQEAVGLVYDTVKDPTLAAKRLVTEALMRGSADNVTAVVVFLSPLASVERVYGAVDGEAYGVTGTAYGSRVRMAKDRHHMAAADEMRDTY